jgi:hypothetical protein
LGSVTAEADSIGGVLIDTFKAVDRRGC